MKIDDTYIPTKSKFKDLENGDVFTFESGLGSEILCFKIEPTRGDIINAVKLGGGEGLFLSEDYSVFKKDKTLIDTNILNSLKEKAKIYDTLKECSLTLPDKTTPTHVILEVKEVESKIEEINNMIRFSPNYSHTQSKEIIAELDRLERNLLGEAYQEKTRDL